MFKYELATEIDKLSDTQLMLFEFYAATELGWTKFEDTRPIEWIQDHLNYLISMFSSQSKLLTCAESENKTIEEFTKETIHSIEHITFVVNKIIQDY